MSRSILSFSTASLLLLAACTKVVHNTLSGKVAEGATRVIPSVIINGVERKPVVITISGTGNIGNAPGRGNVTTFNSPFGMAVDKQGNFYLADAANNMIRKISPGGTVTNFAGTGVAGFNNGAGNVAKFNNPTAVALDTAGNVYVADRNNQRIRLIDINGNVSTLAGIGDSGFTNGPDTSAQFHNPVGIAVDAKKNVFVSDEGNHRIRRISAAGNVSTYAGSGDIGSGGGTGGFASFNFPGAIALDRSGNLYVADRGNNQIRKIRSDDSVSLFAGDENLTAGNTNGNGSGARFNNPTGIAVDTFGVVYVADAGNNMIRRISPSADVTTMAGNGMATFKDGKATEASFNNPGGLAVDQYGDVYVADRNNQRIRAVMVIPAVTTLAGSGVPGFTPGLPGTGKFNSPGHLAVLNNTLYVVDRFNHAVRSVSLTDGAISNLVGSGSPGHQDGAGTVGTFNAPFGIAFNGSTLFIGDQLNNMIRYVGGTTVSFLTGSLTAGYRDGQRPQVMFNHPSGVAIDRNNNLIVADQANNRIRKVILSALVTTTVAGTGETGFVDGPASAAQFRAPTAVVVDDSNNIFVADYDNNAIRKITPAGQVSTLAGGTMGSRDGTGTAAQFSLPVALAIDAAGVLYVADMWNNRIRMVTRTGVVTTLAGYGYQGYEEGPGPLSQFKFPTGIAVAPDGRIFVSDADNNVIRVIQ